MNAATGAARALAAFILVLGGSGGLWWMMYVLEYGRPDNRREWGVCLSGLTVVVALIATGGAILGATS